MACGIYKLINIENKKFYIGSAKDIVHRFRRHISDLNCGKHHNILLQRAWDKGYRKFKFEILEECNENVLIIKEQRYLDKLQPFNPNKIYNIASDAFGGDNLTHNPRKNEIVKKISQTMRRLMQSLSSEERKEKWGRPGKDNPNYGNKWSEEQRQVAKERQTGVSCSFKNQTWEEAFGKEKSDQMKQNLYESLSKLDRNGKNNSFFGKHHTEEYKQKARERQLGIYRGNQNLSFSIDGIIYQSLGKASKKLGIPITTIRWRIKSKNIKFKEYKYVLENF